MIRALAEKEGRRRFVTVQTLFVSTATVMGMGNLVGVVAAISAGGAGAVFWMWISAIFGSSTAFVEAAWRIYTKKKIRSTADITAVRLIISTAMRSA